MNHCKSQISRCLSVGFLAFASVSLTANAADLPRQAEVAKRGADVMPFNLKATTHIFIKTDKGGTQRVVAKDVRDSVQTRLKKDELNQKVKLTKFFQNQQKKIVFDSKKNKPVEFYASLISLDKEFMNWIKLRLGYFEEIDSSQKEQSIGSYVSDAEYVER